MLVFILAHHFSKIFTENVVKYMKNALCDTIDEIVAYSKNESKLIIRYPPGTVYQFSADKVNYINCSIINPEDKINILSFSSQSMKNHDPLLYVKALNSTLGD